MQSIIYLVIKMKQVLYGDVLFFVNFSMDFLTLYITAKILHRTVKPLKTAVSAALGGAYGVLSCFLDAPVMVLILINLAVSLMMCRIAFGKKGVLPCCALFYGAGCLLGGIMTAVFSFVNSILGTKTVFINGEYHTVSDDIPLGWMAMTAVIISAFAIAGGQYSKRKKAAGDIELSVVCGGKAYKISAVCDSGNMLTDPIGGLPVIVMTREAMLTFLPDGLAHLFLSADPMMMTQLPAEYIKRVRLIPSSSVGGESLLIGYIPDRIIICGIEKNAVTALCGTVKDFDGKGALVPSSLIE